MKKFCVSTEIILKSPYSCEVNDNTDFTHEQIDVMQML